MNRKGIIASLCSSVTPDMSSTGHPRTASFWERAPHFRNHCPQEAGGQGILPSSVPGELRGPEQVLVTLGLSFPTYTEEDCFFKCLMLIFVGSRPLKIRETEARASEVPEAG